MTRLRHPLALFRYREDGAATVEMVILFPVFMFLFVSAFELGTVMLRQTMLDRSIDMTVRELRLNQVGFVPDPTLTPQQQLDAYHDLLRKRVCERTGYLADCDSKIKLEMKVVDPNTWSGLDPDADCIDTDDPKLPPRSLETGDPNQMVLIRACHLFEPFITNMRIWSTGAAALGTLLAEDDGYYRLVSTASYVIEPKGP
jgi:hypothetical protein